MLHERRWGVFSINHCVGNGPYAGSFASVRATLSVPNSYSTDSSKRTARLRGGTRLVVVQLARRAASRPFWKASKARGSVEIGLVGELLDVGSRLRGQWGCRRDAGLIS